MKAIEASSFTALPQEERRNLLYLPAKNEVDQDKERDREKLMSKMLRSLKEREREIIKLRYGLGDEHPHTLEQVGRIFKIKGERVRQIEQRAIQKLQELPVLPNEFSIV